MNPNQALWEKGDFTRIAKTMRESGEALVQRIGITNRLRVLDLGCGDGTTALPAARLGADVLGVDIARHLVEAGNRRAAQQGLTNCMFQEGDATNLQPLPDQAFDLVLSIFGAMFAPKPFDVAKEMVPEVVPVAEPGRTFFKLAREGVSEDLVGVIVEGCWGQVGIVRKRLVHKRPEGRGCGSRSPEGKELRRWRQARATGL